jgi:hypothetical protein
MHFTVLVVVPDKDQTVDAFGELTHTIEAMLAPYQENNMGDCPQEYLEFLGEDEETYREEYETKGCYDGKSHKEEFSSFEDFMENWHGLKKDEELGRYGYWDNPNAKWDWYTIGGRWTGVIPVKEESGFSGNPGLLTEPNTNDKRADAVRVKDLDFEAAEKEKLTSAKKFWEGWEQFVKTGKEPNDEDFYGIRYSAISMGLMDCKPYSDLKKEEKDRAYPCHNGMWDVYVNKDITWEEFYETYGEYFNPISMFALLTEDGWKDVDSVASKADFKKDFVKTIKNANENDWLVLVDCHI